MILFICVGKSYNESEPRYGFGLTETEAIADLRHEFAKEDSYYKSFLVETYVHECSKKTWVPIPESWRAKWGLCWFYWFFHWLAVNYQGLTKFHKLFPLHDIDKPLKLTIGMPYNEVNAAHKLKSHHCQHRDPEKVKWEEAICDWEASAFSKPNSQLDAIGTWFDYFKDKRDYVIPVLKKAKLIRGKKI